MNGAGGGEDERPPGSNLGRGAEMDRGPGVIADGAVAVLVVVVVEEVRAERSGILDAAQPLRYVEPGPIARSLMRETRVPWCEAASGDDRR